MKRNYSTGAKNCRNSVSKSGFLFRKRLLATLIISSAALSHQAWSSATIDQQGGTTNQASIVQVEAPLADASISQNGHRNLGAILQTGGEIAPMAASITQMGNDNQADAAQTDANGDSSIMIIQGGTNHIASAMQSAVEGGSIAIDQAGEMNDALVTQTNSNSNADVTQRGTLNVAQIDQYGGEVGESASVYQEGSANMIMVEQAGETEGEVISHQIGANNYASVYQENFGIPSGVQALLTTEGNDNSVVISQSATFFRAALTYLGDGNQVGIYQNGEVVQTTIASHDSNFNTDTVDLNGMDLRVAVDRVSTDNSMIDVTMDSSISGNVTIAQSGSDNVSAIVYHTGDWESNSSISQVNTTDSSAVTNNLGTWNSSATVAQNGVSTSSAVITQSHDGVEGQDLVASIFQSDGADLVAAIEQSGLANEAVISQLGASGVEAYIFQSGSNHQAAITQTGGSGGGENEAIIQQGGSGHVAAINQAGSANIASIVQM